MSVRATGPLWSLQQTEWLQALGHRPLTLVRDQAAVTSDALAAAGPAPGQPRRAQAAEPPATAPVVAEAASAAVGLQRALLRATGLPEAQARQALQSLGVDVAALRGNPAAKRALWPRLRRLRGGPPA